jgi:hypothetical protein
MRHHDRNLNKKLKAAAEAVLRTEQERQKLIRSQRRQQRRERRAQSAERVDPRTDPGTGSATQGARGHEEGQRWQGHHAWPTRGTGQDHGDDGDSQEACREEAEEEGEVGR